MESNPGGPTTPQLRWLPKSSGVPALTVAVVCRGESRADPHRCPPPIQWASMCEGRLLRFEVISIRCDSSKYRSKSGSSVPNVGVPASPTRRTSILGFRRRMTVLSRGGVFSSSKNFTVTRVLLALSGAELSMHAVVAPRVMDWPPIPCTFVHANRTNEKGKHPFQLDYGDNR